MPQPTSPETTTQPTWDHYTTPSFVDVRGLQVAYRRSGSGQPLVYLPAQRTLRRWLPFYEQLSKGCDTIVPELPGFGETAMPDWLDGFDDLVLHVADLCDALGCDRINLAGHSIGAWIAAEFAVFYPERLSSLTLISPFGLRVPDSPIKDIFRMEEAEVLDSLFGEAGQEHADLLVYGDQNETFVLSVEESITMARLMWTPRYDLKLDTRLGRVNCPTLILKPDDDRLVPDEHFARWVELLPNARLATVSGTARPTGHALTLQEPEAGASAILEFIGEPAP